MASNVAVGVGGSYRGETINVTLDHTNFGKFDIVIDAVAGTFRVFRTLNDNRRELTPACDCNWDREFEHVRGRILAELEGTDAADRL